MKELLRKNHIIACFILFLFVTASASSAAAQSEKLGLLRIRVDYPIQVPRSYTFQVNLTVQYAFRDYFEIHPAIYEGSRGMLDHLLWGGETERLIDVGEKTYNVQLTSPAEDGEWTLTGYAFYHDASGILYFADEERGPGFIQMHIKVADNAKLTLETPYGNMPVFVDGTKFSTDQNGLLVRQLKVLARHVIEAPEDVSIGEGWRVMFQGWNGTADENPKNLLINTDVVLTADYADEFRLDAFSSAGQVEGTGWYARGVVANFSVPMYVPMEGLGGLFGIRSRFTGWSGDLDSTANSESVVMDHPYKVTANWLVDYEQLYYLVIAVTGLALAVLAVLVVQRLRKKPPEKEVAPAARTHCMFCGARIDPDAKFCNKCGKGQTSSG